MKKKIKLRDLTSEQFERWMKRIKIKKLKLKLNY